MIEQAQRWSRGQARRIFLQSRPGTGKTRLAATATWRALSDRQVIWVNLPTLITEAATRYGSDERKRAEQMLTSKAAIVLDDLGNENPSAWVRQMLQAVLESRLANEQMIFITSNMPVPQLAARYNDSQGRGGDWLASRLATFKQYVMPGVDRRLTLDI